MSRKNARGVSSAARLMVLAAVAVLLPMVLLSVLQYRSLLELEEKTRAAVQENLRQTLETAIQRSEDRVTAIAAEVLRPWSAADAGASKPEEIGQRFAAIRRARPEVDQIFLFFYCGECRRDPFAFFSTTDGVERVGCERFEEPQVLAATRAFWASRPSPRSAAPDRLTFAQSPGAPHSRLYAFRTLSGDFTIRQQSSFVGLKFKPEYLAAELLPGVISGVRRNGRAATAPVLAVFEDQRQIYATQGGAARYEMRAQFGPVFPLWEAAAAYQNTTIEGLARSQFHQSLFITGLVICCLVLGIGLTLRATAREARLAQLKSDFVSNISHEIKTPLALIRLFAETLELGRIRSQEKLQEYYRVIHNESRRLGQLIENVLDFAKMEAGGKEYRFAATNLAQVVEEVLRSYEYQIASAGFELATDIDYSVPPVPADAGALSQAVLNLLSNAVKYSAEVKSIAVRVRQNAGHIAIEVADRGIGIPRSEHERIFEKFYRVDTGLVHNTKGSGLGLALARHIVEAHNGQILVESAPGAGSRFMIVIPVPEAAGTGAQSGGGCEVAETVDHRG